MNGIVAAWRRVLLGFLAGVASLLPFAGAASADPALWLVRDSDTTIYLFGTIHLLKAGTDWRSDKVTAALQSSDALWLELAEGGAALTQAALWKLGKDPAHPLSTKLTPEERARLRDAANSAGIPPVSLESLRPWLAAIMLSQGPMQQAGYDPAMGVDNQLREAAMAADKPVKGLETAEQQAQFFATLPPHVELALLMQSVAQQSEIPDQLDQLAGAWLAGDADKIGALLMAEPQDADGREFYQRLLVNRNAQWVDQITGLMQTGGTHFIAVGAAHLAGADSLQSMLSKRGFTVARY